MLSINPLPNTAVDVELNVPTPDGFTIYGRYTRSQETPSDKLVIFLHGLTGNSREPFFSLGKNVFIEHGYDTACIDFFMWQDDARKLHEHGIFDTIKDTSTLIDFYKKIYKKIYLVGHSLAGTAVAFQGNTKDVTAACLWDCKIPNADGLISYSSFNKPLGKHIIHFNYDYIASETLYNDYVNISEGDVFKQKAAEVTFPVQLITTPENIKPGHHQRLIDCFQSPKNLICMDDADHGFSQYNSTFKLLEHTLNWFNQF